MTEVILHGALGKEFGEHHRFFIRRPIDAIRALMANKKGFKKAFRTWGQEGKLYEIVCDDELVETPKQLEKTKEIKVLHIAPTIMGTSNAAKIIVGALLVILSFYIPGGWGAFGQFLGDALQGMGFGLIIGGIMGLLFPPPAPSFSTSADARSFLFSSLENSTVQGVVVPLGYGRLIVGSKVISSVLEPKRLDYRAKPLIAVDVDTGIAIDIGGINLWDFSWLGQDGLADQWIIDAWLESLRESDPDNPLVGGG